MSCFWKIVGTFGMFHKKRIKNQTETVYLEVFYTEADEKSKNAMACSRNTKRQFLRGDGD